MNKVKVDIINETMEKKLYVSLDHGEFQVIKTNSVIMLLLRIILNPNKYNVDFIEN